MYLEHKAECLSHCGAGAAARSCFAIPSIQATWIPALGLSNAVAKFVAEQLAHHQKSTGSYTVFFADGLFKEVGFFFTWVALGFALATCCRHKLDSQNSQTNLLNKPNLLNATC